MSVGEFDCWPADITLGAAGGASCAIVAAPKPNSAEDNIRVNASRFKDYTSLFLEYVTDYEPDDENGHWNSK
jgi:hypothetical protein